MTPTEVNSSVWSRRVREADCQLDHRSSNLRLGRSINFSPILESESRSELPLWFLFVVGGVAICYGFGSAFLGTLFAAVIFFFFLRAPFDQASVRTGRLNTIYMIVAGAAISYVLSASPLLCVQKKQLGCVASGREKHAPASQWVETTDSNARISEEKHEIESV